MYTYIYIFTNIYLCIYIHISFLIFIYIHINICIPGHPTQFVVGPFFTFPTKYHMYAQVMWHICVFDVTDTHTYILTCTHTPTDTHTQTNKTYTLLLALTSYCWSRKN